MKHPMQPQKTDDSGVLRFVENGLVRWLVDQLPNGMNDLSIQFQSAGYSEDDYDQILQLIGYSVSGIPYRDLDKHGITDNNRDPNEHFEIEYKELKNKLRPVISELFNIHEDDLI